jgi:hypothetical protein
MLLTLLSFALTTSPDVEVLRIQEHLRGASAMIERRDSSALTPEQLRLRRVNADRLLAYTAAGRFPKNRVAPGRVPVFRDEEGTLCAVGALLWASGEHTLVAHIVATRNTATVNALADEPGLAQWLEAQGLTLAEAARIQPSYEFQAFQVTTPTYEVEAGACSPVVQLERAQTAGPTAMTNVTAWSTAEIPSPFVWSTTVELFDGPQCVTRLVPQCSNCSLSVSVSSALSFRQTEPGQLTLRFSNGSGTYTQVHRILSRDAGALDAGTQADAGGQVPTQPGGCGCEGGGSPLVAAGALALLHALRRPPRRRLPSLVVANHR